MVNSTLMKRDLKCEVAYVLIGEHLDGVWLASMKWRRRGAPLSVEFDWRRVMEREERSGDVVGFLHTHPRGCQSPSSRDDATMIAWSSCFGKPLLCLIDDCTTIGAWLYDYRQND